MAQISGTEKVIISAALLAYPILALSVRHVVGACFLVLALISFKFLWQHRKSAARIWDHQAVVFAVVMALPTLAVVLHQIYHLDFHDRPYDETSRFLFAVPIYLMLRHSGVNVEKLAGIAFPIGALVTLFTAAVFGDFAGSMRLQTDFLNTIHFGDLALVLGMVSLFSIRSGRSAPIALLILQVAGFAAGLYLSIRTGSRGGWIAVPVLLLIWLHYNTKSWRSPGVAVGGILILALCVGAYFGIDSVQSRLNEIFLNLNGFFGDDKDTSVGMRLQIWGAALHLFLDHPLFGLGQEGYREQIGLLGHSGALSPVAVEFALAEVHQQFLGYAVIYGLAGLLSMLAVFLVPLAMFVRVARSAVQGRDVAVLGICVVCAFLIFGLTVEIFNLKLTVTFYTMTVAMLLSSARMSDGLQNKVRVEG